MNVKTTNKMYRYSTRKYNCSLIIMGCIRIGTLHDFRRSEHNKGICDPKEGKKTVSHHIENLQIAYTGDQDLDKSKDFQSLSAFRFMNLMPDNYNVTIKNVTMSQEFDHPNCYILCMSRFRSKQAMKEFEGTDSCIEIVNIPLFYHILTDTLNSVTPVIFRGIHEVIYQNREEPWNGRDLGYHPALIKEEKFHPQGEYRAIWQPRYNQAIEPIIIGNYRMGALCKHVSV